MPGVFLPSSALVVAFELFFAPVAQVGKRFDMCRNEACCDELRLEQVAKGLRLAGPDPRKVDTSGVSYAAWVSVADVSASKSLGARRLHQECRLRVL